MKVRQDDYWNKIALYNTKISELEAKEIKDKKKNDQIRMQMELNNQVASQNQNKSD